jgi:hypothetical protein
VIGEESEDGWEEGERRSSKTVISETDGGRNAERVCVWRMQGEPIAAAPIDRHKREKNLVPSGCKKEK